MTVDIPESLFLMQAYSEVSAEWHSTTPSEQTLISGRWQEANRGAIRSSSFHTILGIFDTIQQVVPSTSSA